VDRAARHFEMDVTVGADGTKALVDADQLDRRFSHKPARSPFFIVWSMT